MSVVAATEQYFVLYAWQNSYFIIKHIWIKKLYNIGEHIVKRFWLSMRWTHLWMDRKIECDTWDIYHWCIKQNSSFNKIRSICLSQSRGTSVNAADIAARPSQFVLKSVNIGKQQGAHGYSIHDTASGSKSPWRVIVHLRNQIGSHKRTKICYSWFESHYRPITWCLLINKSIKTWIYIAPLKQKFTEAPVTSRHAQKVMN